jgi:phosphoribosyl 1,2-cyclic phosphodiesterase
MVMPLLFQSLASGSKGNAILVCSQKTRILLDAGLSARELVNRLQRTGVRADQLDAVVISHEHTDHVRGLGTLSRRFDLPVYLTQGTLDHLPLEIGQVADVNLFQPGNPFAIGDLRITPFAISHDARDPAGFVLEHEAHRLGVCTDLGIVTQLVRARLQGCQGLILEANHDPELLLNGPYPPPLKQRIRSRHGHLSNAESFELLQSIHHRDLQIVLFAHLSEVNNQPDLVLSSSREFLNGSGWDCVTLEVGKQHEVSKAFALR